MVSAWLRRGDRSLGAPPPPMPDLDETRHHRLASMSPDKPMPPRSRCRATSCPRRARMLAVTPTAHWLEVLDFCRRDACRPDQDRGWQTDRAWAGSRLNGTRARFRSIWSRRRLMEGGHGPLPSRKQTLGGRPSTSAAGLLGGHLRSSWARYAKGRNTALGHAMAHRTGSRRCRFWR